MHAWLECHRGIRLTRQDRKRRHVCLTVNPFRPADHSRSSVINPSSARAHSRPSDRGLSRPVERPPQSMPGKQRSSAEPLESWRVLALVLPIVAPTHYPSRPHEELGCGYRYRSIETPLPGALRYTINHPLRGLTTCRLCVVALWMCCGDRSRHEGRCACGSVMCRAPTHIYCHS